MPKANFIFSLILTSLLLLSCRKENYHQLLRSENKLASANGNQTILYSIHTEKGTIIDLYRDRQGCLNIYKVKSGVEPHDIKLTIKDASGRAYPFTLSYLSNHRNRNTHIRGPIKVLKNEIILFEEGKNNTTPDAIYTIKSELTSVDILYWKKSKTEKTIVILNHRQGSKLSSTIGKFLFKTTDGKKFEFNNDYVAELSLEDVLDGDLASVSVDGVYLYNTAEHTIEKREIKNTPCNTNVTEEIIYDINTTSYPAPNPVGSGIFSIRRTMNGQIFMYQENASGPGNSSVQYEIIAAHYQTGTLLRTESRLVFNENIFSSNAAGQKINTKLNGLITVKRNGIILFDELDEIKKKMTGYPFCASDFLPKPKPTSSRRTRGLGRNFYPMPLDGSPLLITIRFISPCIEEFRRFIMDTANEWVTQTQAHIRFILLDDHSTNHAHIRIDVGTGLENDGRQAYSYVGLETFSVPDDQPTMRLPLVAYNFPPENGRTWIRQTILHEFGHALGLDHEHQNPNRQFAWNIPAIYASYYPLGRTQQNESDVSNQFLRVYNGPTTSSNQYDPFSVMNYVFPSSFTFGSICPPSRRENISNISEGNKTFIATVYPKPVQTPSTESNKRSRSHDSDEEHHHPHKKKPDFTDTTNEPPGPESSKHWVKPQR